MHAYKIIILIWDCCGVAPPPRPKRTYTSCETRNARTLNGIDCSNYLIFAQLNCIAFTHAMMITVIKRNIFTWSFYWNDWFLRCGNARTTSSELDDLVKFNFNLEIAHCAKCGTFTQLSCVNVYIIKLNCVYYY